MTEQENRKIKRCQDKIEKHKNDRITHYDDTLAKKELKGIMKEIKKRRIEALLRR